MKLAPTNAAVRVALGQMRAELSAWRVDDALCAASEQVLAEVLNNVVEHAMAGCRDGTIKILVHYTAPDLKFEVRDNGIAMPGQHLPAGKPMPVATKPNDLPEGGFGWHLIRSMTQDLRYDRADTWNRLQFRIDCGPG